jgi:hypothetical protein
MKTTSTRHSRPDATIEAAATVKTAILAAILLGITASPTRAGCNPADRIDARCYADLQDATEAAIAANEPLWLPAGTYTLDRELVIDYAPLASTGFQIISDGAIIDATGTGREAVAVECGGGTPDVPKSCFYFHIQGTLFINADAPGAAGFRVGRANFSDAHNSAKIDHLIVNNRAPAGIGVQLEYVLNADIFTVADSGTVGLLIEQVQFSHISGAASATADGIAMLITNGYTFANTIQAIDLEVAQVCLAVTSPYVNRNTFVSPYLNCPLPVSAGGGTSNLLLNPSYGAAQPPAPGSQAGILTLP